MKKFAAPDIRIPHPPPGGGRGIPPITDPQRTQAIIIEVLRHNIARARWRAEVDLGTDFGPPLVSASPFAGRWSKLLLLTLARLVRGCSTTSRS